MNHEPTTNRLSSKQKRRLNLDTIAAAAIAIADEEGLDALSMRHVADRLGRAVMSLYRHVESREHLTALIADRVLAEEPFPGSPPPRWRDRLRASAFRQWDCYQRHPWLAATVSFARPTFGPNGLREMEWAFEGLQGVPVSQEERLRLYLVVTAYVHGAANQVLAETEAVRRSGLASREWWESQAQARGTLFSTGEFPLIARLAGGTRPTPQDWFEFGLDALLDGLELRLPSRGPR